MGLEKQNSSGDSTLSGDSELFGLARSAPAAGQFHGQGGFHPIAKELGPLPLLGWDAALFEILV